MANNYWFFHRRKELKLNQGRLAERLRENGVDVTQATVSAWETGRHNPPMYDPNFRKAFAKALELEIHEMLQMAGYEIDSTTTQTPVTYVLDTMVLLSLSKDSGSDLTGEIRKRLAEFFGTYVHLQMDQETTIQLIDSLKSGEPIPPLNIEIKVDKKNQDEIKLKAGKSGGVRKFSSEHQNKLNQPKLG